MSHRPNNSDIALLLQREDIIVVLKKHNRLAIQLARKIDRLLAVDQLLPLLLGGSKVRVLEETLGELCAEETGDGGIDDFNVELSGFDEGGDLLEVAIHASLLVWLYIWGV